jgi:hypothetical protein
MALSRDRQAYRSLHTLQNALTGFAEQPMAPLFDDLL